MIAIPRRAWRAALIVAAVVATVLAIMPHPPTADLHLPDKWQHMAAFTTLTVLAVVGWPDAPLHRIGERISFLGAMIEVVQSIPALHRDCDIMDWAADTYVVVCVLILTRIIRGPAATL